jgi:hypothetical protein
VSVDAAVPRIYSVCPLQRRSGYANIENGNMRNLTHTMETASARIRAGRLASVIALVPATPFTVVDVTGKGVTP